ncbi:nolO [Symbiodinium natans]|uniref:NolO protein n=1 Tax=Symbiodinium natans TaxID=878477 RepID=A0A812TIT4_9DINO|nr:nolO [Symbiodinium natans]
MLTANAFSVSCVPRQGQNQLQQLQQHTAYERSTSIYPRCPSLMLRVVILLGISVLAAESSGSDVCAVALQLDGETKQLTWNAEHEDIAIKIAEFAEAHQAGELVKNEVELVLRQQRAQLARRQDVATLPSKNGAALKQVFPPRKGAQIALYNSHEANIAISIDGRVQCVLELERLFGVRYFAPSVTNSTERRQAWLEAAKTVRDRCECEGGPCPRHFDTGILVRPSSETESNIIEEVFSVDEWRYIDHQEAHAAMGFYASSFRTALVVVSDAAFHVFHVSPGSVKRLAHLDYGLGTMYMLLAGLLPEVTGQPLEARCGFTGKADTPLYPEFFSGDLYLQCLSWAGKLMGYAAAGTPAEDLQEVAREAFEVSGAMPKFSMEHIMSVAFPATPLPGRFHDALQQVCASDEGQRNFAASVQAEFERITNLTVTELVRRVGPRSFDGVVLTGGCALNVLANQRVHDTLQAGGVDGADSLDVWVPPSPNDGGLAIGGLWSVAPPMARQPLQYLGFSLWDAESLDAAAEQRQARSLSQLGGVDFLADLLAGQGEWALKGTGLARPIIAVVRGRQEFGPRALGHRSLLAVPDSTMKDRMNRLKARQWYRPVAPMIAEEDLVQVFGRRVLSPFMSMAPSVRPEAQQKFPALAHFDGTARHQSVSRADEPWVHALLLAVGKRTGLAALINTSFNTKGKPIVNTVRESLRMLDDLPDLDYVVIGDWLFEKARP